MKAININKHTMKMIIQTPGFKAQKKLTNFVKENVGKLESLSERILEAQVCLKIEKSGTKENKICELKLVIPGNDLFTSRQDKTFEEAILKSIEAAKHQLERWKNSGRNKKS